MFPLLYDAPSMCYIDLPSPLAYSHPHQVISGNQFIITGWQQGHLVHYVRLEYGNGWFSLHPPIESHFLNKIGVALYSFDSPLEWVGENEQPVRRRRKAGRAIWAQIPLIGLNLIVHTCPVDDSRT
jgi:hypothetical protein